MNLRVAFVSGAVLPLDLEKEVLHFAERTAIYGVGEFFDNARGLWRAPSGKPRDKVARSALARNTGASPRWTLRDCGCSDKAVAAGSLPPFARSATRSSGKDSGAGKRRSCRSRVAWKGAPPIFAARRESAPTVCSPARSTSADTSSGPCGPTPDSGPCCTRHTRLSPCAGKARHGREDCPCRDECRRRSQSSPPDEIAR